MTTEEQRQRAELEACTKDPAYFVFNYVYLLNKPAGGGVGAWVPFKLWPFQVEVLDAFRDNGRVIVLKARQLGLSWLALAFAMWLMLFRPIAEILIFSKTEEEAIVMLEERLKGIYRLLPDWMKCRQVDTDQATKWILSNGSTARAFSKRGGDSYNASLVILDEFDVLDVKDQDRIMRAVDPTVGDGGKLFQISRVDKDKPESMFKVTFKGSWERRRRGEASQWAPIFLGWHVRPDRDRAWYESKALEILERTGSHDDLHEQYPATPEEALQPRTLNKRFPAGWLGAVYARLKPLDLSIHTSIPPVEGLRVYAMPEDGVGYVMGGDVAEGLIGGDESALSVKRKDTGESVAHLAGQFEPGHAFPSRIALLSGFYNEAAVLPERNAHCGGQLMRALEEYGVKVLLGHDNKPGWNTSTASKTQAHDSYATMLREAARVGTAILHDPRVYLQLSSIDRNSLCAPGKRQGARAVDDESTAEILADMARSLDSFEYRGAFGPEDVLSAGLGQRLQRRTLDPKEEEKEAAAALWLGLDDFLGL